MFDELQVKFTTLESIEISLLTFNEENQNCNICPCFDRWKYSNKLEIKNIFRANDKIVNSLETWYNMEYIFLVQNSENIFHIVLGTERSLLLKRKKLFFDKFLHDKYFAIRHKKWNALLRKQDFNLVICQQQHKNINLQILLKEFAF